MSFPSCRRYSLPLNPTRSSMNTKLCCILIPF
ncbi:hypothetical protein PDIG_22280 [Penicillium digitatum PHI26]|uniref:Uncharacterized protein n=2 Tax=Penicillium digitatum TaxID=36651 RepID=K9G589_PEND2|nr:hypothetical protein PDIP_24560 [Penicillium digitatum Pd1]EKV16102.1 hypothetical protein PDIG_22280 [Penicillium digitatum PHI26]EKV19297.1 hypothetical protein PDIP_24560 [Penicillium digitatum Pd1]